MRLKKKYLIAAFVLAGLVTFLSLDVDTRVTRIDFSKLYSATNIYEHDYGHEVVARGYPSQDILGHYDFRTPRGMLDLSCNLRDYQKDLMYPLIRRVGPTAEKIGDDSFFAYEGIDSRLMLAYRRFNVLAYFKVRPDWEPPDASAANKEELQRAVKILDEAIVKGNPAVTVEKVPAYRVVWTSVKSWVGGIMFLIFWHGRHT